MRLQGDRGTSLYLSPPYCLERGSLTEPEAWHFSYADRLGASWIYIALPWPPTLGLQECTAMLAFLHECWRFELRASCSYSKCSDPPGHLPSPRSIAFTCKDPCFSDLMESSYVIDLGQPISQLLPLKTAWQGDHLKGEKSKVFRLQFRILCMEQKSVSGLFYWCTGTKHNKELKWGSYLEMEF